jgi:hypothetical protein
MHYGFFTKRRRPNESATLSFRPPLSSPDGGSVLSSCLTQGLDPTLVVVPSASSLRSLDPAAALQSAPYTDSLSGTAISPDDSTSNVGGSHDEGKPGSIDHIIWKSI